jgi:cellulose biosynthesis protein BcsQ
MLVQSVAILNGKGGVGKTSLTSNVSGLVAAAGYRVLAVDLDPQGNLSRDLGYFHDDRNDFGMSLHAAVSAGQPIQPLQEIRPRLDVVPGGKKLKEMTGALYARGYSSGETTDLAVRDALQPIESQYDLILFDCPPGEEQLQRMALAAAHFVVIPTKSDAASVDGLVEVADLFTKVRGTTNPQLELLGVALFGIGASANRIARDTRNAVARDLGTADLVFEARIRHVEGAANNTRDLGKLVHEVEAALPEAQKSRLANLRGRHRANDSAPRLAASAKGLAEDYQALATELMSRVAARLEATA